MVAGCVSMNRLFIFLLPIVLSLVACTGETTQRHSVLTKEEMEGCKAMCSGKPEQLTQDYGCVCDTEPSHSSRNSCKGACLELYRNAPK